jgi:putative transposase
VAARALGAPGAFISILRTAHACELIEFPTREAVSQFNHEYTKKPPSQRHHEFSDGSRVQRDLYSAYLASFV